MKTETVSPEKIKLNQVILDDSLSPLGKVIGHPHRKGLGWWVVLEGSDGKDLPVEFPHGTTATVTWAA